MIFNFSAKINGQRIPEQMQIQQKQLYQINITF